MSQLVVRSGSPLRGSVRVPGDKSISHRAVILGAIAEGPSQVDNFLRSADCRATVEVVRALGTEIEERDPESLVIHGRGLAGLREPEVVLNCVRSGTTMRLLAGLLAGQPFLSLLSGEAQLRRRPMGRVVEPLRQMGALILGREGGKKPPLAIQGGNLRGFDYALPVASAQVKSALLLAGLFADAPTRLHVPGPARDHTERMLLAMGATLRCEGATVEVEPCRQLQPLNVNVPGDFSSAAFLIVAATLVPGSEITIEGVGVNQTRTGLLDVLQAMGADICLHNERTTGGEPVTDLTVQTSELSGVEVEGETVVRMIDEFPILAVAASQAKGQTLVRDASELRVKETDRIATAVQELRRLGAEIEARPDGFVIQGPTPLRPFPAEGGLVHSHGDHRLAMALTVAGLVAQGETRVQDVSCIADSFPGFEAKIAMLGGQVS